MSAEITVRASLAVRKGNLQFQSQPSTFKPNLNTASPEGPTPGSFAVTTAGVACSLANISAYGGWCIIQNYDATNYVTFGIKAGGTFYPLGEIQAGEQALFRMSRNILYGNTGTSPLSQQFWFVATGGTCIVSVQAFDS